MRFASVTVRKDGLRVSLWLTRAMSSSESPCLVKVNEYGPGAVVNDLAVRTEHELESLGSLIEEARAVGDQLHERQRRRYSRSGRPG